MTALSVLIGIAALMLLAHGLFSMWLMLHAWNTPGSLRATSGPDTFKDPELSFSVIIPARDEEAVIAQTMARIWEADYPRELLEIIVVCQTDDPKTISAVWREIEALKSQQIRLLVYEIGPFNKPHALNFGYAASSHEVVTVFDAEDDVHRDIFNVINTVMIEENVGIVQGGVQLMNFRDHWFSAFNCVEYFYYFRSRMHFNARVGMVPLGGNTVSIRRGLIRRVGGWDTGCLTEDADIGVRLSALGERIRVVYDSRWVTREETPHTLGALVRQRTRWGQGFLQVLAKGDWRRIPGRRRRALALLTFAQPLLDGLLLCFIPLAPLAVLFFKLPVVVALVSLAPLYVVALQMLASTIGIIEFGRLFGKRVPVRLIARMPFTYMPFQGVLGFSALRAIVRNLRGEGAWEKTEHRGAHRAPVGTPLPQTAVARSTRATREPAI
jgi:cellulose synthase/poly-beta-1,6-N-acetylglucosamine synthase-like glycosyltransferase